MIQRRDGFTLMEIVLAIALTSVVMYLLMTAVELYMIRVDSSRGRVESAQLARAILDRMADDIAAMRLDPPAAAAAGARAASQGGQSAGGPGTQSGQTPPGGQGGQGAAGGNFGGYGGSNSSAGSRTTASGAGAGGSTLAPTTLHGLFGTAEELRIDRGASPNWARASREVDPTESTSADDLPRTVRYYLIEGTAQTAQEFAQRGVQVGEQTAADVAGLYREMVPTASLAADADPLASPASRDGTEVELLAPEVVKLEFHYFDGEQFVDEWDVVEDGGLPSGVEILLTIHEPDYGPSDETQQQDLTGPRYDEKDLVVYRRFVRIPKVTPPQPAAALLPAGGQGGGPQGNAGSGNGPNNGPPGQGAGSGGAPPGGTSGS